MQLPRDLIGAEAELPELSRAILALARSFDVPTVGGYHITCSDETEWECARAFHRIIAAATLPPLKADRPAAFHTMNLGARYESGAARIAEHHYAVNQPDGRAKLMIVKINSHVSVDQTADGPRFGTLDRYGIESTCCGALTAMFTDASLPALDELRQTFRSESTDRIALLRDEMRIPASRRLLYAAVVNARLQAARAVDEMTATAPHSPTVWLVFPCVTLNYVNRDDTELLIGQYTVDATEDEPTTLYQGLGDMPSEYRLGNQDERIVIEDDRWPEVS